MQEDQPEVVLEGFAAAGGAVLLLGGDALHQASDCFARREGTGKPLPENNPHLVGKQACRQCP